MSPQVPDRRRAPVHPCPNGQPFAILRNRERGNFVCFLAKGVKGVALAKSPQVTPFPAAQILLARLRPLPVQHFLGATQIIFSERQLHQLHVRCISLLPGDKFCGLGLLAKTGLIRAARFGLLPLFGFFGLRGHRLCLRRQRFMFGMCRPHRLPGGGDDAQKKRSENDAAAAKADFVPANRFLNPVGRRLGGRATTGLVVQVPLEIRRQTRWPSRNAASGPSPDTSSRSSPDRP